MFITLGVLAGLALARAGLAWADPALALGVAVLVGRAGYQILRRSIPSLVDERAFDQGTIQREAEEVPGVCIGLCHSLASCRRPSLRGAHHRGGRQSNVASAHHIADQVEDPACATGWSSTRSTVHVEPC